MQQAVQVQIPSAQPIESYLQEATLDEITIQVNVRGNCINASCNSHLTTVYPGGSFMGLSFARLRELGTGTHQIDIANQDKVDFLILDSRTCISTEDTR
jgi:hypothetical protein